MSWIFLMAQINFYTTSHFILLSRISQRSFPVIPGDWPPESCSQSRAVPLYERTTNSSFIYFFERFYYFFLERREGRERERNINVWLPLVHPLLGTWPATQACALTGNQTGDPLVRRPALNHWATPARAINYSVNNLLPVDTLLTSRASSSQSFIFSLKMPMLRNCTAPECECRLHSRAA